MNNTPLIQGVRAGAECYEIKKLAKRLVDNILNGKPIKHHYSIHHSQLLEDTKQTFLQHRVRFQGVRAELNESVSARDTNDVLYLWSIFNKTFQDDKKSFLIQYWKHQNSVLSDAQFKESSDRYQFRDEARNGCWNNF